nr:hypothetical protein [Tanacetum cinerariifolium]
STTPPTPTPTTIAESAPRLSVSAKGKQPLRATTPVEPIDLQRTEEEPAKDDEEDKESGKGGDEVRESEDSEKENDDEEEQESRLSEEARIQEEQDAEELYRDININQGRGLQVNQNVE